MTAIVIADALGLLSLWESTSGPNRLGMLDELTHFVEGGMLGFPREVVDELKSLDRSGAVSAWSVGLGTHLDPFNPSINHLRRVMTECSALGFPEGASSLDGKDHSVLAVARLGVDLEARQAAFCVLSTDVGEHPLRPTMENFCNQFGWTIIDPTACRKQLGIKNC